MKKFTFTLLFVFCFGGVSYAQSPPDSSMEEYIRTYRRDYQLYITNARQVIEDNIPSNNWGVINRTISFMDSITTESDERWLSSSDRFLIHWIHGDLSYCTSLLHLTEFFEASGYYPNPYHPMHSIARLSLSQFLRNYIVAHRDSLRQPFDQGNLPADTTQFLELFSFVLMHNTAEFSMHPIRLNEMATAYIQSYPESPFIPIVKQYIRKQYRYTGFAYGGRLGYGYSFGSKTLSQYFPAHSQVGLSIDLIVEPWIIFGDVAFSFNVQPEQAPFIANDQWPASTKYVFRERSLGGGYRWKMNGIHVVPYAGVGLHAIAEAKEKSSYETPDVFAPKIGVMFELPLHHLYRNEEWFGGKRTGGSLWIKLEYLNPWYDRDFDSTLTGSIYTMQVSFGLYDYSVKRRF